MGAMPVLVLGGDIVSALRPKLCQVYYGLSLYDLT